MLLYTISSVLFLNVVFLTTSAPAQLVFSSSSISLYEFEDGCPEPEDQYQVDPQSIDVKFSENMENNPVEYPYSLDLIISWSRPSLENKEQGFKYFVAVRDEIEGPFLIWTPIDCINPPSNSELVGTATYTVRNVSFTHKLLFQVIPVFDGTWTSRFPVYKEFQSPECFDVTKDYDFCSTLPVATSSKPMYISVSLDETDNKKPVPTFKWSDPVQVNGQIAAFKLVVTNLANKRSDVITIRHEENVSSYSYRWADSPNFLSTSGHFEVEIASYVRKDGAYYLEQGNVGKKKFKIP